ncbi:aquaporin-1-like [Hypomesus transpacificus]|uniref:aquaporin-1-like n=1 Tax=Hypomesus transpacificus TaxID=137520 RepID=UPI001F07872E|nr:aquaporin-1-like [Hypomesus transpacificus]
MMAEFKSWLFWRAVMAELVGMILFIFIGISSAIGNKNASNPDQEVKVALAFGLAIATLAQSLGHISGAHLNPAITLGLLVSCQISFLRAALYILAQMLGAIIASAIIYGIDPNSSLGVNSLNNISAGKGFAIEFLATLQLVLCVIAVTDKRRNDVTGSAPLAIGLSVGLGHLAAISFTGCGINPARSFGPALIMEYFDNHWVYWLGPMCGGIAASLLYDFLFYPRSDNFSNRWNVLSSGEEVETAAPDVSVDGSSSPVPSQWPRH